MIHTGAWIYLEKEIDVSGKEIALFAPIPTETLSDRTPKDVSRRIFSSWKSLQTLGDERPDFEIKFLLFLDRNDRRRCRHGYLRPGSLELLSALTGWKESEECSSDSFSCFSDY
jgi:hypothetical protein